MLVAYGSDSDSEEEKKKRKKERKEKKKRKKDKKRENEAGSDGEKSESTKKRRTVDKDGAEEEVAPTPKVIETFTPDKICQTHTRTHEHISTRGNSNACRRASIHLSASTFPKSRHLVSTRT